MTKEELFAIMKGTIIVSCQATPGEPLYDPVRSVMPLMARAAKQAGAKMIRTSSVRDIIGIKEETGLPVIGLIKREYPGYTGRITMTMREVDECMEALADIVSIDCTDTARGDGLSAPEFLREVKKKYPHHHHGGLRHPGGGESRRPGRRGSGRFHHERIYCRNGALHGRTEL